MPGKRKLKIGIVGCGAVVERYHIPVLNKMKEATIAGVVDIDQEWVRTLAHQWKIPFYSSDYHQLLGKVDAVLVATPNVLHAEIAGFFLENGIHVLCEKPLALSSVEASHLFELAENHQARLMAGHTRRFGNATVSLIQLARQKVLGNIKQAWLGIGGDIRQWGARTDYRQNAAQAGGGVIMDLGIHIIDRAIALMGDKPDHVSVKASCRFENSMDDSAEIKLLYPENQTITLVCNYLGFINDAIKIQGELGRANVKTGNAPEIDLCLSQGLVGRKDGLQKILVEENDPYTDMHYHFVESILNNTEFMIRAEEVIWGLEVVEDCYKVLRENKTA